MMIWLKPQHLSNHYFVFGSDFLGPLNWNRFYLQKFFKKDKNKSTSFLNISVTPLKALFRQNKLKRVSKTYKNTFLPSDAFQN